MTTLLIDKGRHKVYGTFTGVAVVGALRFFKIFIWSELHWWALKEWKSCCPQIDLISYSLIFTSWALFSLRRAATNDYNALCPSISLRTLVVHDLYLIRTAVISCPRAKQLFSAGCSYITFINVGVVDLGTPSIGKGRHKRNAMLNVLAVSTYPWKMFNWSRRSWWAL